MPAYRFRTPHPKLHIGKLICLARNYYKHAEEMHASVTTKPLVFLKPSSAVIFNHDSIVYPKISNCLHHEVELGVVIGNTVRQTTEKNALDAVVGYLVGLDITARDLQNEAKKHGWPWSIPKGFDTFAPLSDVILKKDIQNPNNLAISLAVNGKIRQESNTRFMVHTVEQIISYLSSIMTLYPGDLILTGTPEGVDEITMGDHLKAYLDNQCMLEVDVKAAE